MAEAMESVTESMLEMRREETCRVWKTLHTKESILREKYRVRWIPEGDSNSKYFDTVMKKIIIIMEYCYTLQLYSLI